MKIMSNLNIIERRLPQDGRFRIKFKGREIMLWFGGIDDKAWVWINGKALKCIKKGAAPSGIHWEFVATEALKIGGDNVIVVKISNRAIDELGTGGITEPAMFWAKKVNDKLEAE